MTIWHSMSRIWFRLVRYVKINGTQQAVKELFYRAIRFPINRGRRIVFKKQNLDKQAKLFNLLEQHSGFFDWSPAPIGWNAKMFQRYQHISMSCAELGGFALYGGHPSIDKDLSTYSAVTQNLYVYDATDKKFHQKIFSRLANVNQPKIVRIHSVDLEISLTQIYTFLEAGFKVIYEYIDLLLPEILGVIPPEIYDRHHAILTNEKIFVVATSNKLLDDVKRYRSKNFALITNGVDVAHWRRPVYHPPSDLQPLLASGRYLVGYHGTLASWINYEILRAIANDGRYDVLLIGLQHDTSFKSSGLAAHPRVHYLGSKQYHTLNQYAAYYDVAILPFLKNDMTDTVSPVKIFEYMAAGKPIVSTNLAECEKYSSCLIAKTVPDFLHSLDEALERRKDVNYQALLASEAIANSWRQKAQEMLAMVSIIV